MRLKEITYAKKVGLPNFGSLGLSVVAEVESGDDLKAIYEELKKAVEENINGLLNSEHPSSDNGHNSKDKDSNQEKASAKQIALIQTLSQKLGRSVNTKGLSKDEAPKLIDQLVKEVEESTGKDNSPKMTESQRRYIFRLLAQQGIEEDDALNLLLEEFGVKSLSQVERAQAKSKIGELLGQARERGSDGSLWRLSTEHLSGLSPEIQVILCRSDPQALQALWLGPGLKPTRGHCLLAQGDDEEKEVSGCRNAAQGL